MTLRRIGKYEVQSELGRGTMGEVFRAFDPVLKRYVALKTMLVPVDEGDETLERFRREARAAALLNHPNIVTVYDFGKEGPLLYMAMELLKGTDLRTAIDDGTLATLDERLEVMDGVLSALEYAHAEGVVHRDIKPANIHLGPGRHVKIMDFGLARVGTSEMTQEGIVLGTPNYMSPEQALGDRVDARTDLFSVGAVLYELLTGHKPFEAESTPSVLFQVVHKEAPPVQKWEPGTPVAVCDLVRRALQKDRARRFESAREMRAALAEARRAAAAPAGAPSPPAPRLAPTPPPLPDSARAADGSIPPVVRRAGVPPIAADPRRGDSATLPMRRRAAGPVAAAALGLVVVVLALVGAGLWARRGPRPTPNPSASTAQVGQLTEALVATQVQLAHRELDDKNYAAAVKQAESALSLSPGNAEARRALGEAREKARELESAVESAQQLAEKGETEAASQQLARVLDLDPRHPAAVELSARLNSQFRARVSEAAESMRQARAEAVAAGAAGGPAFQAAADVATAAAGLASRGEFADATRGYLESRDAFQRVTRSARPVPGAASAAAEDRAHEAEPRPASTPEETRSARAAAETSPVPSHGFTAEDTVVSAAPASGPSGFESSDVSARRPAEFSGRLLFQVVPPAVRAGDPFVVRVRLVNEGRRSVKLRALEAAVFANGRRTLVAAKIVQREVAAQREGIVAEYSGEWHEGGPWALEAVVVTDRGEKIASRLRVDNPRGGGR